MVSSGAGVDRERDLFMCDRDLGDRVGSHEQLSVPPAAAGDDQQVGAVVVALEAQLA